MDLHSNLLEKAKLFVYRKTEKKEREIHILLTIHLDNCCLKQELNCCVIFKIHWKKGEWDAGKIG